jgi:hypothetical protein
MTFLNIISAVAVLVLLGIVKHLETIIELLKKNEEARRLDSLFIKSMMELNLCFDHGMERRLGEPDDLFLGRLDNAKEGHMKRLHREAGLEPYKRQRYEPYFKR